MKIILSTIAFLAMSAVSFGQQIEKEVSDDSLEMSSKTTEIEMKVTYMDKEQVKELASDFPTPVLIHVSTPMPIPNEVEGGKSIIATEPK